jgi:subtilisin family serine protease
MNIKFWHRRALPTVAAICLGIAAITTASVHAAPSIPQYKDVFLEMLMESDPDPDSTSPAEIRTEGLPAGDQMATNSIFFQPRNDGRTFCARYRLLQTNAELVAAKTQPAVSPGNKKTVDFLNEGGGTLLWSNVISATQLIVQLNDGITPEQFNTHAQNRQKYQLGAPIAAAKGLYRLSISASNYRNIADQIENLKREKMAETGKLLLKLVEPSQIGLLFGVEPSDPKYYTQQDNLRYTIHAPDGWAITTGIPGNNPTVDDKNIVAVLDTGLDRTHQEFTKDLWKNSVDIADVGNGEDEDGNGFTDDRFGWDFLNWNRNSADRAGHGTLVAGIIGADAAATGGVGVAGVCWGIKLMPLRCVPNSGIVDIADVTTAVEYINTFNQTQEGARRITVANHSFGATGFPISLNNAINQPLGTLSVTPPTGITANWTGVSCALTLPGATDTQMSNVFPGQTVTSTGALDPDSIVLDTIKTGGVWTVLISELPLLANQTGRTLVFGNTRPNYIDNLTLHVCAVGARSVDADAVPIYPACLPGKNVVSVGATDRTGAATATSTDDELLVIPSSGARSDYGLASVDLFAPGKNITGPYWISGLSNQYKTNTGTSFAAPQVAGAAALYRYLHPAATNAEIHDRLACPDMNDVPPAATPLKLPSRSFGRLRLDKFLGTGTCPP